MSNSQESQDHLRNQARKILSALLAAIAFAWMAMWDWSVAVLLVVPVYLVSNYALLLCFRLITKLNSRSRAVKQPSREALSTDEELPRESFEIGKNEFVNGNRNEALAWFDMAILMGESSGTIYEYRALTLQSLGYHIDAISDLNVAIRHLPEDCDLWFTRSNSKAAVLDFEGAISDIDKAIELAGRKLSVNTKHEQKASNFGFNDAADFYHMRRLNYVMSLEDQTRRLELEQNCESREFAEQLKNAREQSAERVAKMTRKEKPISQEL